MTPEKIAALKATHGEALFLVELDDVELVIKPPTRPQFDEYVNGNARASTSADAQANLAVACTVSPPVGELQAFLDRLPAAAEKIADELEELGGRQVCTPVGLDELTADELKEAGITPEQVKTWQGQYPRKGQIAAFRTTHGLLIFRRPSRASYNTLNRRSRELDNLAEAMANFALDACVYPDTAGLNRVFALAPALPTNLSVQLRVMAGAELEVRRKKI